MYEPSENDTVNEPVNETVFIKVTRKLQQLILDGKLSKGDKLPSERTLAQQLGISRNILREVLRSLSLLGLIESKHGVGNRIIADFNTGLFMPLSLLFKLENGNIYDVVVMRYILDTQAAGMATHEADYADLDKLRAIVSSTKAPLTLEELVQLEINFHTEISRLTKNLLLYSFMQAIILLMKEQIPLAYQYLSFKGMEPIETIHKMHEDTLRAIERKDTAEAVRLTADSYEIAYPMIDFSKIKIF